MNSVRDAGIGTAVVIGAGIAGMDAVGTGAAGMATGIGVLAAAGTYGVMAIGSASAADGGTVTEPGKPRLRPGLFPSEACENSVPRSRKIVPSY